MYGGWSGDEDASSLLSSIQKYPSKKHGLTQDVLFPLKITLHFFSWENSDLKTGMFYKSVRLKSLLYRVSNFPIKIQILVR